MSVSRAVARRLGILRDITECSARPGGAPSRDGAKLLRAADAAEQDIVGEWYITPHAIDRFIERVRPWWSREQAFRWLVEASQTAQLRRVDEGGVEHWQSTTAPRCRLRVTRNDHGQRVLMTVLTPHDGWRTPKGPGDEARQRGARLNPQRRAERRARASVRE